MENNETIITVEPRILFVEDKVEILTLSELKKTVSAKDVGKTSKTRPVTHYQFIEDIMQILTDAGQAPILDHIYCQKSGGTKIIPRIEEQMGYKGILDAWLLDKLIGKIFLPNLNGAEMQCAIAFAYHDKGLDLAFGVNVHDCQNMNIFGDNVMHTYGSHKDVNYPRMLEVFKEWSGNLEEMHKRDLALIRTMQLINVTGAEMLKFVGKLSVKAAAFNMGIKVVAPLNVTQTGEVIRGIIKKKGERFYDGPDCTLWEFFNFMTAVMKGDKADATGLITDIAALGNMVVEEFKVEPTIDEVILNEEE